MALGAPVSLDPTWGRLAKALGVSIRTIGDWRKLPDAPTEPSIERWTAFVDTEGLGKGGSRKLTEIKVEIAKEDLKRKIRENAIGEGKVIAEEDIRDFLLNWSAKLDLLLSSELETNAPPLMVGQPIAEVRAVMRSVHDRIREATARGLLSWKPPEVIARE